MSNDHNKDLAETISQSDLLDQIVAEYLRAVDGGRNPNREELIAKYPDLADDLREFFADRDGMNRVARPFRAAAARERVGPAPELIRYFGDYEVLDEIGHGGMGVIYKAKQVSLSRTVALKMLREGRLENPDDAQRFRIEAEAAAGLDHPNIVPIYEVGEHDGRQYFSMKLVDGGSLSQRIDAQPLPPREAAAMVAAVAHAVHYAHQRGILHRDLKPANILLEGSGVGGWGLGNANSAAVSSLTPTPKPLTPLITDFGLAKRIESDSELTQTGAVIGTPSYMAPEQASGQSRNLTIATDVYGLGAVLFAALTGRAPFIGDGPLDILDQVKNEEPPPPSEFNPLVDRDLDTICLKCLQKEPQARYASAEALARDLEHYLAGEPVTARPIGVLSRSWRWCRRKPAIASLTAALVLVTVIGSAVFTYRLARERSQTLSNLSRAITAEGVATRRLGEVEQANQAVEASLQDVKRAEAERSRQLFDSLLNQARARRWSNRVGQRFESLDAIRKASELLPQLKLGPESVLELRNEAIAAMTLLDLRLDCSWPGISRVDATGAEFSPSGETYAMMLEEPVIVVCRTKDNQEVLRITEVDPRMRRPVFYALRMSPDGRLLATHGRDAIPAQVWDLTTGKRLWTKDCSAQQDRSFDFSPDSRELALPGPDGTVVVYNADNGAELRRLETGTKERSRCIRYHPAKRQLAVLNRQDLRILDFDSGNLVRTLPIGDAYYVFEWDPNGQSVVVATGASPTIWDVDSARQRFVCRGHSGTVINVAFNHAGNLIATTSWDETTRLWDSKSGRLLLVANGFGSAFSQDDRWLEFGGFGSVVGRWEVGLSHECRAFRGIDEKVGVTSVAISSDNRLLVSGNGFDNGGDGTRFWDLERGTLISILKETGVRTSVFLHPSNEWLLTSGPTGTYRWAIHRDASESAEIQIGPGEDLKISPGFENKGRLSADGTTFVALCPKKAVVIDWNSPYQSRRELNHSENQLALVGISPDGHWVGTAAWHGQHLQLWDARTGKPEKKFAVARVAPHFSPDGKWLVLGSGSEFAFHHVGSWEPSHSVKRDDTGLSSGPALFSADSQTLAISYSPQLVKLVDPATGNEFATLAAPDADTLTSFAFSPDGSVFATGTTSDTIHVWDLRRIRAQLAEMGLDWNLPAYPPIKQSAPHGPITVAVDSSIRSPSGELPGDAASREQVATLTQEIETNPESASAYERRGDAYRKLRDYPQAIADVRRVLKIQPENVAIMNRLAWLLVVSPPETRNANEAWSLIQRACELDPRDGYRWNTRGAVEYRLGKYDDARQSLQKTRDLTRNFEHDRIAAFNGFLLAMTYHKLGDNSLAASSFRDATSWLQRDQDKLDPGWMNENRMLRAEAEALLGLTKTASQQVAATAGDVRQTPAYKAARAKSAEGDRHRAKQEFSKAIACYREVIEHEPNNAGVIRVVAWLLVIGPPEVRDGAEALKWCERAGELDSSNAWYHWTIGAAQYRVGQYEAALSHLQQNERLFRDSQTFEWPLNWFLQALCLAKLERMELANATYDKSMEWFAKNVGHRSVFVGEAKILQREFETLFPSAKLRRELQQADAAIAQNPNEAEAYARRGRLKYELDQLPEALADWNKALELNSDNVRARRDLLWVYLIGPAEFRDTAKALPLAEQLAKQFPNHPPDVRNLGTVYLRLKRSPEAVDSIRRTIELRKNGPFMYDLFFLALAYHQNNQPNEARAAYDQAMQKWSAIKSPDPVLLREVTALRAEIEPLLGITPHQN